MVEMPIQPDPANRPHLPATSRAAFIRPPTAHGRNQRPTRITGKLDLNVVVAFVFGVVFLSVMLVFATNFPNPTSFQLKVFMVALSTAASGVGAMLPGNIDINYKGVVRAGGALALFAIVWFSKPVIEQNVVQLKTPEHSAQPVIDAFLADLKAGDIARTYAALDVELKGQVPQEVWGQLYADNVKPLGEFQARRRISITPATSPPGVPLGIYAQYLYTAKYSNSPKCLPELITVRATQNDSWDIYGYQVGQASMECPSGLN